MFIEKMVPNREPNVAMSAVERYRTFAKCSPLDLISGLGWREALLLLGLLLGLLLDLLGYSSNGAVVIVNLYDGNYLATIY